MSGRRKKTPPAKRAWIPLAPAVKVPPSEERIAATRVEAERLGHDPDVAERMMRESDEMWKNDRYTVIASRHEEGWVRLLSVRRNDRGPDMPWRHLQRIKNQIAGDEAEALELFPAESRLVDTANQRWLWCVAPGSKIPVGFDEGRHVTGPEEAARFGAKQAALEEATA